MPRWSRVVPAVVLAASIIVASAACSSDGDDGSGGTSGDSSLLPPVSVTSSTAPTTTAATTTTAAAPTGAPDAATAAQTLYDAWTRDDRATAATVAEAAAIDAIWAAVPGPYQLYRGCDTGEFDTGGCLFRDRSTNHTIQVDVERRDTGGS